MKIKGASCRGARTGRLGLGGRGKQASLPGRMSECQRPLIWHPGRTQILAPLFTNYGPWAHNSESSSESSPAKWRQCKYIPSEDSRHRGSATILPCSESDLKLFWLQGEIGLPGPPGHDGEKVRMYIPRKTSEDVRALGVSGFHPWQVPILGSGRSPGAHLVRKGEGEGRGGPPCKNPDEPHTAGPGGASRPALGWAGAGD